MVGKASFGETVSALARAGRTAEAVRLVEGALKTSPRDVPLLTTLAQLHNRGTRSYTRAREAAEAALARAPRNLPALMEAAQACAAMSDFGPALDHLATARAVAPRNPDVLYVLAATQHRMDRFDEEVETLDAALALRPDHPQTRLQRATALTSAGRLDEAAAACRALFAERPDLSHLYGIYATAVTITADDPLYLQFRDTVVPAQTAPQQIARCLRVLAKMEDDLGHHDRTMELTGEANAAEGVRHDAPRHAAFVAAQIGLNRADYMGRAGLADDTPVLIVGMPRSGSTLLEQVLTRHGEIGGVGESDALRRIVRDLGLGEHDGPALAAQIRALTDTEARALGQRYLDEIRSGAGDRARIVDKKLHNFEYLGLIARILPRARILHALRDPMDTCVSCYLQRLSPWHSYTRDLGDLGRYYRQYRRLMDHWATALPNPVLAVRYEDMVSDTEGTARRVVDFLGLEWDPACLDHRAGKEVRTLSAAQVRQPIYRSSIEKWRRYDSHLGPLKAELAGLYEGGLD